MSSINVAFSYFDKTNLFDPAEINDSNQAILIENIFGKLLYFDDKGNYIPDIPNRFYINDSELHFVFDGNSKTNLGRPITPRDFEYSFKRSMILSKNTHANLKEFICDGEELNSLEDKCEGLVSTADKLILKVKNKAYIPFLLQVLASVDFVALHSESYEHKYPFKIISVSETTGPYYIEKYDTQGRTIQMVLKSNRYNKFISKDSLDTVHLIDLGNFKLDQLIQNEEIDVIPTNISVSEKTIEKFAKNWNLYQTNAILTGYLRVSKTALSKFSTSELFYVADKIKKKMFEKFPLPIGAKETYQYFQESGVQNVNKLDLEKYKLSRSKVVKPKNKIEFLAYEGLRSKFEIFSEIEEINLNWIDYSPISSDESIWGDMHLLYVDSSFNEDLTLTTYNFSVGTFDYSKDKAYEWRKNYMNKENFFDRIRMVNDLQMEMLEKGKVIPLFVAPYSVLTKKGLAADINKLVASTYFWQIRIE